MGPRGEHSREEFLALVTDAAEAIARAEGLRGLGMRRVASAIGYAPNSIYNALGGLDDIILRVNARTLGRLRRHLQGLIADAADARANTLRLADGYLDFVLAEPRLWSLLFEHTMSPDTVHPDWYADALGGTTRLVDEVLAPLISEAAERHRAVAALWASLHGIASLAASAKLKAVTRDDPRDLAHLLVGGFLDGIAAAHARAQSIM